MKALILIVAALAPAASGAPARSAPFNFDCVGKGKADGYPFGVQDLSERYRIESDGRQVSVFRRDDKDENICPAGAACTVLVTEAAMKVHVSDVPNHDPGYSMHFQLDRRRLSFEASGGGLDGGWSIAGKCKPERRRALPRP